MYQFSYADIVEESFSTSRERERAAIARSIELLTAAESEGTTSRAGTEALLFTQRLWSLLIEDLAKPENDLPSTLRASLISIGLWMFREIEDIRLGKTATFKGLIEISETISEGLK
ncbi:MAG: flagellar biosynthesis regulator FlaF [Hyphomicrobium sp.]